MTPNLTVFSSESRVEKMALSIELLNRGWRVFFVRPTAWEKTVPYPILPSLGEMESEIVLCAWKTEDPRANDFEALLADLDFPELRRQVQNSKSFAGAKIITFDAGPYEELRSDFAKMARPSQQEVSSVLKNLKDSISISPDLGRSPAASDFRQQCLYSITKLCNGVAQDPDSGQLFHHSPPKKSPRGLGWLVNLIRPSTQ